MLEYFCLEPDALKRYQIGPLGLYLEGFVHLLSERGYSQKHGMEKIRLVALLSHWLAEKNMEVQELDEQRIMDFRKAQKTALNHHRQVEHTLAQWLQYLRQLKIIPDLPPAPAMNSIDLLLRDYGQFLTQERGLNQASLDNYLPIVRRFLSQTFGKKTVHLDELTTEGIREFIFRDASTYSPKRVQLAASALRSFLGFVFLRGQLATPLAASVPTIATGHLAEMPQFLEPAQVQRLLQTCDRSDPCGQRDYAVLSLLARLGLRAGEVVHLCLEDINWSAGEVLIRGKSARQDRLPLLSDVGRALAGYLQKGRPLCSSRRVFIRMKAPHVGFSSSVAICNIVRRALLRAKLRPKNKGAHLLRRSLATQMLRGGASLTQIGQILRHQRAQTTEIYAKVNLPALRTVAQPWPKGV